MPRTDDLRIREMKELTPPSHLIREFPVTPAAEETASAARVALHRILHGQDDRLMVVIGPCSSTTRRPRWNTHGVWWNSDGALPANSKS